MSEVQQEQPDKHYFTCLPHINLGRMKEVDLGFAKIWNFDLAKEIYIPDENLRKQVEAILHTHKGSYPFGPEDNEYLPIHGIGIISTGEPTDSEPRKYEREKINDARLITFISALARRNVITRNANSGHGMASSENYQPLQFSVVVGSKYSTFFEGFVIPSWHGGIDLQKEMLIRPRHVPIPSFDPDEELLGVLVELREKRPRIFRRTISAVEVFFESYYNTTQLSHNARILLQASAFEILLGAQSMEGRKTLKSFLKKEATYPHEEVVSYMSERRGKFEREIGNMREKWADRFFTLRNHIIHGYVPKEEEYYFGKWQRHFDIATLFFIYCLKVKVEQALRRQIFGDDVVWKTWTDDLLVEPKKFTGFEYDNLGPRWWTRRMKKLKKK